MFSALSTGVSKTADWRLRFCMLFRNELAMVELAAVLLAMLISIMELPAEFVQSDKLGDRGAAFDLRVVAPRGLKFLVLQ